MLANVINKLAENKKSNHIPYRDSKLTRILSQGLGGNSLTAIICTVSPAAVNYYQTISTIRFALRAKVVSNSVKINLYEKLNTDDFKQQLTMQDLKGGDDQRIFIEHILKTNESLTNELKNYKGKFISEIEKNEIIRKEIERLKGILYNREYVDIRQYAELQEDLHDNFNNAEEYEDKERNNLFKISPDKMYVVINCY